MIPSLAQAEKDMPENQSKIHDKLTARMKKRLKELQSDLPFWKKKPITELTKAEWESLCDGCARCCLIKFQDEEGGEVFHTRVVCRLLDLHRCTCTEYERRTELVPTCLVLSPALIKELKWIPKTCAYRLLAEGKELRSWHPLISGNRESVHRAKISVRHFAISETVVDADQLEDYIDEEMDI